MDQLFRNMWKFSSECSQIPVLLGKCIWLTEAISRKLQNKHFSYHLIGNRQLPIHS